MKYLKIVITLLICCGVVACTTTTQIIPTPVDSKSSGVGITLKFKNGSAPYNVHFVRLEETGTYAGEVIMSNFQIGSRFYLLNASPGKYSAVAAYDQKAKYSGGYYQYLTFFSENLIKLSEVTVNSGEFAYMGECILKQSIGLGGKADEAQKHFSSIIKGYRKKALFKVVDIFYGNYTFRGEAEEFNNDEETKKAFITQAKEDLKESYWSTLIAP